ncbi:hypothetical protein DH2020_035206 [Rehmannia glutinosa]|uniref:Uncharacterized protein n=1 Tax=Rehmannia glutinosa TaxID=99300 RepID=A0ABR0V859_REHGL
MLDQISPSALLNYILYFPCTIEITDPESFSTQTTEQLKHSLSLILTRFYPLAGRVNIDGQSIICNDQGVPFLVAKFPGQKLSDHLPPNPNLISRRRLIPCDADQVSPGPSVARIQANYFDCGGVAIGVIFWHKVLDGISICNFLNSWAAATTRGLSNDAAWPNYIAQYLFPHREDPPGRPGFLTITKNGKSVRRRYVFDALSISELKAKSSVLVQRPTRVEVVSALIWKCFMAVSLANNCSASVVSHVVNLRRRAEPPFPSECFGNFIGFTAATNENNIEKDHGLAHLVRKIRDGISKIDGDYINRMYGDEGLSGYRQNLRLTWSDVPEGADVLKITSWCGFGLYTSADFGWGKPVWLASCDTGCDSGSPFSNVVWLMDTRDGDGIEAWVTLDENYMSVFNDVEDLRALACINPCPLDKIIMAPIRYKGFP